MSDGLALLWDVWWYGVVFGFAAMWPAYWWRCWRSGTLVPLREVWADGWRYGLEFAELTGIDRGPALVRAARAPLVVLLLAVQLWYCAARMGGAVAAPSDGGAE